MFPIKIFNCSAPCKDKSLKIPDIFIVLFASFTEHVIETELPNTEHGGELVLLMLEKLFGKTKSTYALAGTGKTGSQKPPDYVLSARLIDKVYVVI